MPQSVVNFSQEMEMQEQMLTAVEHTKQSNILGLYPQLSFILTKYGSGVTQQNWITCNYSG